MVNAHKKRLAQDLWVIMFSIIIAIIFAKSPLLDSLLGTIDTFYIVGSFVAGLFFTSVFTTAPAVIVLGKLGATFNPWTVALVGAVGSVIGDLVIFTFMKGHISEDIDYLLAQAKSRRIKHIFKHRFIRWSLAIAGAMIIASPLPDELGLTLMGMSRMSTTKFVAISYVFNVIGILMVSYIARGLV
jgi:uncharacterized membrane protein YdjX (TVP38/TMEM64 family)